MISAAYTDVATVSGTGPAPSSSPPSVGANEQRVRASTVDQALAAMRVRWDHPPLDRRDVEERIALRMLPTSLEVVALGPHRGCPACRIFVRVRHDASWSSRYVHTPAGVDDALDALLEIA